MIHPGHFKYHFVVQFVNVDNYSIVYHFHLNFGFDSAHPLFLVQTLFVFTFPYHIYSIQFQIPVIGFSFLAF